MTMETGAYSPGPNESETADAQALAAYDASLAAELRQVFIDFSRSFDSGPGVTEAGHVGLALQLMVGRLNRELRSQVEDVRLRLDEVVDYARMLALLIGDDEFKERLAMTLGIVDRLNSGNYIFPSIIDDDSDGDFDMRYAREPHPQATIAPAKVSRVGRIRLGSDGQPLIAPQLERVIDDNGVSHVGIALHVAVELSDGAEAAAFVRPYAIKDLPLLGDKDIIKSALKKRLGRILNRSNVLNIQSLAEDFGLIGDDVIKNRLQKVAHDRAGKQLVGIVKGGLSDVYLSGAPRYLMLYDADLMNRLYDHYAHNYVELGVMLGETRVTLEAHRFFVAHTRAAWWIAEGAGKKIQSTLLAPEDVSLPSFETAALQAFLSRGVELQRAAIAEALPGVRAMFPRLFSDSEIDPS